MVFVFVLLVFCIELCYTYDIIAERLDVDSRDFSEFSAFVGFCDVGVLIDYLIVVY